MKTDFKALNRELFFESVFFILLFFSIPSDALGKNILDLDEVPCALAYVKSQFIQRTSSILLIEKMISHTSFV